MQGAINKANKGDGTVYNAEGTNGGELGNGNPNNLREEPTNEQLIYLHYMAPHGASEDGQIYGYSKFTQVGDQEEFNDYGQSLGERVFRIEDPVQNTKPEEISMDKEGNPSGLVVRPYGIYFSSDKYSTFKFWDPEYGDSLPIDKVISVVFQITLFEKGYGPTAEGPVQIHITVLFEIVKEQ